MHRFVPNRWWLMAFAATALLPGALWLAQGRSLFSVEPGARSQRDAPLDDLFAPTGVLDELGRVEGIGRGFRLGLLPSGFGLGLISVSTLLCLVALAWLISSARRPSGACRRDRCRRSACP